MISLQTEDRVPSYISKYEALLRATSIIQEPWWITNVDSVLSQSVIAALKPYHEIPLPGVVSALESVQKHLDATKINYLGIYQALDTFQTLQGTVLNSIPLAQSVLSRSLLDAVSHALTLSEPYLTSEVQEVLDKKIQSQIEETPKKRLTLSEILTLLTLLVSIYSAIIASRPSEQLERISQQNQIIIEQQAEMIALNSEDKALYDALDSLADSINLLSDEVELLREQLESSDDPTDSFCEVDHAESQQDDSDTQDDAGSF